MVSTMDGWMYGCMDTGGWNSERKHLMEHAHKYILGKGATWFIWSPELSVFQDVLDTSPSWRDYTTNATSDPFRNVFI